MSYNPQQPNNGSDQSRPMPPNYSQASGPQQPYSQQNSGSQQPGYDYQQPGQPGYGSQQNQAPQQNLGSQQQNPQSYGPQQGYGSAQSGSAQPGQQGYGSAQQLYGANYGAGQSYQQGGSQYAQQAGGQQYSQQQYAQQPHGYAPAQPVGNPAMFNSQILPENAYGPGSEMFWQANESDRATVLWTHIGALFIGFLPLIMFLVKKDESPFVREHSRQGLNAWITNAIITTAASLVLGIIGFILALVTFGFGMLIIYFAFLIPLVYVVLYIIAAVAGNKGEGYKFPLVFNFVK